MISFLCSENQKIFLTPCWQPCTWNGNSPCLTVDSSHRPRPECCWKPSIEKVLTLWILVLAKIHLTEDGDSNISAWWLISKLASFSKMLTFFFFFFKYDEKFWLEWIILFEEIFVVLVIFTEVASFKFTFILINSVWKHFVTLLCDSDWHPTLLFGPTLLGTFANVSPYSVIQAYSVSDFEKCATLLCYISLLC